MNPPFGPVMSAIIFRAISVASAVMARACLLVTEWRRSLVYRQAEMKRAKWKSLVCCGLASTVDGVAMEE